MQNRPQPRAAAVAIARKYFYVFVAYPRAQAPSLMPALRYLRDALVFAPCYVALDWASYIDPVGPFNITPWNPQAGLAIVWLLPNTQQILRGYQPGLGPVTPAEEPAMLRHLEWRPTLLWAVALSLLTVACVLQISRAVPFIYYQF